ncbi:uncharacterized protein LOC110718898 isoform X4 [Chenopodium quinoa]|uniref:uncharacterized protein LOC110718898 isoform X4 n=1 Tax=Chenopodium quinoa TaxID=63459 RepID=UPI000B7718C0|nr:uncharacterized protein LOC110718898 isoform X4 [Chenopodium quinoa]
MAAAKRAIQFGVNSSRFFANSRGFAAVDPQITRFNHNFRQFCQLQAPNNNRRGLLVDTLALVRNLEAQGVPENQAEAITNSIAQAVDVSMEKMEMLQDSNISRFKGEVKTSQDHHFSLLQRQNEKLHNDIEMLRSELRYEFDKIINAVKAQLEAGKVEMIRIWIGTLASTVAVGLAIFQLMGT